MTVGDESFSDSDGEETRQPTTGDTIGRAGARAKAMSFFEGLIQQVIKSGPREWDSSRACQAKNVGHGEQKKNMSLSRAMKGLATAGRIMASIETAVLSGLSSMARGAAGGLSPIRGGPPQLRS